MTRETELETCSNNVRSMPWRGMGRLAARSAMRALAFLLALIFAFAIAAGLSSYLLIVVALLTDAEIPMELWIFSGLFTSVLLLVVACKQFPRFIQAARDAERSGISKENFLSRLSNSKNFRPKQGILANRGADRDLSTVWDIICIFSLIVGIISYMVVVTGLLSSLKVPVLHWAVSGLSTGILLLRLGIKLIPRFH